MSLDLLFSTYDKFITAVPEPLRWLVSLGILVLLVYFLVSLIKRSLLFLILLILFVPASLPLLLNLWQQAQGALNLLGGKS